MATVSGGNFQSPWTRSLPSEIVASYFSTTRSADEFVPINHHNYYITLKITGYCAEHAIRWLQEGLAYGDIIVPLGALRDQPPIYYFVTHIGRPQDWVEAYLRDQFEHFDIPVPDGGYQQLTDKEIDRIVVASRTVDRGAVAQSLVAAAAALPELTYEEWRAGVDDRGEPILWDHDEPLAERRERNAADVAARPLANPRHYGRALYAFIDLPSGTEWTTVERYRARWLMEAIEAGDVVVPYAGRWTNELGYSSTTMRRLRFAVFAAGVPPDAIEEQLSLTLRYWERMWPETIEPILAAYRALAGMP